MGSIVTFLIIVPWLTVFGVSNSKTETMTKYDKCVFETLYQNYNRTNASLEEARSKCYQ